jgi:hypothetical protein
MNQTQTQTKLESLHDHAFETVYIISVRFQRLSARYGEATILKIYDPKQDTVYEAYTFSYIIKQQLEPILKSINKQGRVYKAIVNKQINYMALRKLEAIGYTEGGLE